jgi:hypothetical protein
MLGLFLAACTFLSSAPIEAQDGSQWFPDVEPFKPLIATPREIQVRASFVAAERPETVGYGGQNIEAELAVGHRLELIRLDDRSVPNRAITLGIEMGIHSRFFMETAQKDLINSDFRVGLPISIRSGQWESRISLRHISSHLGDDYLVRFLATETAGGFGQTSKDGFEGILARKRCASVRGR